MSSLMRVFPLLCAVALLAGCQTPPDERLNNAVATLKAHPSQPRAQAEYRKAAAELLPQLIAGPDPSPPPGYQSPARFSNIEPVRISRVTEPELHRPGIGLPAVGILSSDSPNAPRAGFKIPLTALILPTESGGPTLKLADPDKVQHIQLADRQIPVAADFETPLTRTRQAGPSFGTGIRYLIRADKFTRPGALSFIEPCQPSKIPVVFVHGLMSTPRMWEPVVKSLMADPEIRAHYQMWFFFYPTGQPVALSSLQLREALTDAVHRHHVRKPMVLIGHSMGGLLCRAQVSGISERDALQVLPWLNRVQARHTARRSFIFQPRTDISRVVFLHTPHRGSNLALSGFAGLSIQLIRLPSNIVRELEEIGSLVVPGGRGRLPTSIHGLSPNSPFLAALNKNPPNVPNHTILGDRGNGSDGVVPVTSARLNSSSSEVVVRGGHGSFSHPASLRELRRILRENLKR